MEIDVVRAVWTVDREQYLLSAWRAGDSALAIGDHLGVSENSVISKAYVLGLSGRNSSQWPDSRVERLKTLWGEGLSASVIAAMLGGGITRNAVIGKVHRLELEARVRKVPPRKNRTPEHLEAKRLQRAGRRLMFRRADFAVPEQPIAPELPHEENPCQLLDLTDDRCRWPIGDVGEDGFHFCGAGAPIDRPYCAYHSSRAYAPSSRAPKPQWRAW